MRSTSDATTITSCWLCLIVSAACNLASSARLKTWSSSSISAGPPQHVTDYACDRKQQVHSTVCIPEINLEFSACSESLLRGVIFFWKSSASWQPLFPLLPCSSTARSSFLIVTLSFAIACLKSSLTS
jgi:hypothetical protein